MNRVRASQTKLLMGLDVITSLRTEYISAALCTNQTPRSADVCLQLGTEDGRAVFFIPRTIRELITSSLQSDGVLSISARRQLKQQYERRKAAKITYVDQRADDLKETEDESVDVVISLQVAEKMHRNGLDWKRSIREAARVLKPGGRLLFVEQSEIDGESYLDYVQNLSSMTDEEEEQKQDEEEKMKAVVSKEGQGDGVDYNNDNDDEEDDTERYPIFDDVGFDDVNLVLVPHIAGVALKSMDAGLTTAERMAKKAREEKERVAELSLSAFERGNKKRKRRKKKKAADAAETDEEKESVKTT